MTISPTSPGLILGGGASGFGNGEDDPNQLAQLWQNMLSGAGDIVSGLSDKVLVIQSGAIELAASAQAQAHTETSQEVANNLSILGSIAAYCRANGIVVQVDANLTNGVTYGDGTDALVDQWSTAAAAVGLPITSIQNVEEIGSSRSQTTFANFAGSEANAVHTLIKNYAASSYNMTAGNLAVGDMEGGTSSSMTTTSAWWQAYNAAAQTAGVQGFSSVTADMGWDVPWTISECTPVWEGHLEALSTLAASDHMSLNVDIQGMQADASNNQYVKQTEENAAQLAMLAGAGSIVVGNLEIETWQQLPAGIAQVNSPTSTTNIAAAIDATYPLYAAGSITAQGPITASAPGQAIVTTGLATSIAPLLVQWNTADVLAGHRLGVVIIDQTGSLSATQHGLGTVTDLAANILVLSGNSVDLAAELSSIKLTEPNSGADTIDIETFGTAGQLSDNQVSILALQAGQNPVGINATSNLQGWVSSSAFLNAGTVMTSETLSWNTTGTLAGTIAGAAPGQSAFVKLDAVHEPLAEYGVENATTINGTAINAVADVNDPAVDNQNGIVTAGGAANNPGQNVTIGLASWLASAFDPHLEATLLTVRSTTNTFNPISGKLQASVDSLAPDPLTVVNLSGTAVANAFATQFNTGGTQVVEYNTGNNPAWQAGWGSQFGSATLTYDDVGKLVEQFLQGGPSNPSFTIDDVFDPKTGALWEEFQSAAAPAPTSYSYPVPGFATGPLYITEFNTGDNPNWDYLDWGTAVAADTEVRTDYFIMQNMAGFFVANDISSYDYEFVNGSTLDLLNLPGTINVDLNSLGTVVIASQTLASELSNLSAIDAAGASGTVTLTGLAAGGSTLIGGNRESFITGHGHDTIIAGNGFSTINTGSGGSTVLLYGTNAHEWIFGTSNIVTVGKASNNVVVEGGGDTVTAVAGDMLTDVAANTSLTVKGNSMTTKVAGGDTVTATGSADVVNFTNGGTFVQGSASSSVTLNGSHVTVSMNAAGGTVTAVGNYVNVSGGANAVVNLVGTHDTAGLGNFSTVVTTGNSNTLTVGSNSHISVGDGTTGQVISDIASTVTLGNNVSATISGSGSIINSGTASAVTLAMQNTMTIAAGASLAAAITNAGTIDLASGTLVLQQAVSTSATFLLGGTATLDFVSAVASGAGMQFIQPGGTMEAQAAGSFGAQISGFAAGDSIDAAAVLYGLAPTLTYSAGTLTLTDGTHADSFALLGTYIATGFHVASDGHNGTAISYT